MDIKTKFNIGDNVFFMHQNKVKSSTVESLNINVISEMRSKPNPYDYDVVHVPKIIYKIKGFEPLFFESALFSSKQELIESL